MARKLSSSELGCSFQKGNEYLIYTCTEYASHLTYHYEHYQDQHTDTPMNVL